MRVLSGIQPSGTLHLGNYFGAMKQHVEDQQSYECFFFIANYHALTTIQDAQAARPDARRGPRLSRDRPGPEPREPRVRCMKRRDESQPPRRRPPPRRSRWRGLLTWSGTLACLLILLAAAACLRWTFVAASSGENLYVAIAGGSINVIWGEWVRASGFSPGVWTGPLHNGKTLGEWWAHWAWPALESHVRRGKIDIVVPLWAPFVLIGLPTAWLWWRDRGRVPAGGCAACGYDLTGNVSGRCPECGALRELGSPKSEV